MARSEDANLLNQLR